MDENKNTQVNLPESTDACAKCDGGACSCPSDIGRCNLTSTNWLDDVPDNDFDIVEVLFKNTRRGFYRNSAHIPLKQNPNVLKPPRLEELCNHFGLTPDFIAARCKKWYGGGDHYHDARFDAAAAYLCMVVGEQMG